MLCGKSSYKYNTNTFHIQTVSEKTCFTQIYRDLYEDAMVVPIWMGTNMANENQQKHLLPSFVIEKREFIPRGTHKRFRETFPNT